MKSVGRSGAEASDVNDKTILLKHKDGRTMAMKDLAHHFSEVHIAHAIIVNEN